MTDSVMDTDTRPFAMRNVDWAELRFPPINLWVVASLSECKPFRCDRARNHRPQRPGMTGKHATRCKKSGMSRDNIFCACMEVRDEY